MIDLNLSQAGRATKGHVKDVTLSTFMTDVIEESKKRLVIVDFWATWCGPCKQLAPVLEKVVNAAKGSVLLAKIDIDKNQQIAMQMGVQSVPAVFAIYQGRPVDGFAGALPESQIKAWLDRLLAAIGGPQGGEEIDEAADIASAIQQADAFLEERDLVAAQSIFADVLERDPANATAYAGIVRCYLAGGDAERARQLMAAADSEMAKDKVFESLRTTLELAEQAAKAPALDALRIAVDKNPADHQARFDLAMACYAAGQQEDAVDHLVEIVRRSRTWNEDGARKQLVKFFEAFGPTSPLTISGRKKLSSVLFA